MRSDSGPDPAPRTLEPGERTPATWAAYESAWRTFAAWCEARGVQALPASPAHVANYLTERVAQGRAPSTVYIDAAAISAWHRDDGLSDPTRTRRVARLVGEQRRRRRIEPRRGDPLTDAELDQVIEALPATSTGRRDRALLLVMRECRLRPSEAAALRWGDVAAGGVAITVRPRTRRAGGGSAELWIISERARQALAALLPDAEREPRASVFLVTKGPHRGAALSARTIGEIVQRRAKAAGLAGRYYGHSLRRDTDAEQLRAVRLAPPVPDADG